MYKHYFKMMLHNKNNSHTKRIIICIMSESDIINNDVTNKLFTRCAEVCKKHDEYTFEYVEHFENESEC